jgi:hypothetical protein
LCHIRVEVFCAELAQKKFAPKLCYRKKAQFMHNIILVQFMRNIF